MSELLTLAEAAKVLKVSPATLTRWTRAKLISVYLMPPARGRRPLVRYVAEDLTAFLLKKRRPARGVVVQRPSREELRRSYPALVAAARPARLGGSR